MEIFKMVFSPIEVNTYILADRSGVCAVIDCGCYNKEEFERFTGFMRERGLEPVLLLNTHCHLDHIFGNGMFLKEYGIGTLYHVEEERNRRDSVMVARFFGLEMEPPPEPAGLITDSQIITFGSVNIVALHVPGHAPGSLAFYCEKEGLIFTGDTLFAGSIGRTDLPGGNHETIIESIKKRLFILPYSTVVYPGHGGKTTIEREINTNPYFN